MKTKNAAAVALGRKGGLKGGPARAASLSPEQRSQSARKAVSARWGLAQPETAVDGAAIRPVRNDTSDQALMELLQRLKATVDPDEIRVLSEQLERLVFHKQFENA